MTNKTKMKFNTTNDAPDFEMPKIAEGIYTGELVDVQEFESEYGKGLRFYYNVEGQDVKLTHLTSIPKNVHPDTKLGALFIAHGKDLGGEVELEQLIGTKAKLLVEDKVRTKNGQSVTFSNISKIKKIE